jgi:hypothetical protein
MYLDTLYNTHFYISVSILRTLFDTTDSYAVAQILLYDRVLGLNPGLLQRLHCHLAINLVNQYVDILERKHITKLIS